MKKKALALLMGTAVIALAACGGGDDKETSSQSAAEKLYGQKCQACHGADLKGGGSFPDLTQVGSRLTKEQIENIIVNGQNSMPAGQLTGADATTVAEWLAAKK